MRRISSRFGTILTAFVLANCIGLTPLVFAVNDPFLGFDGPVFPNPVISTKSIEAWGMLEGDFNEDGLEDLAVIGETALVILLGNVDHTFTRISYSPLFGGGAGAIGDFNEDNHQDLAFGTVGSIVNVVLGNGDGTFGPPIILTQPQANVNPWGIGVADFNNDNNEDILAGFWNSSPDGFAFFAGNGDGTFDAAVTFGTSSTWDLRVADFNEDGNLDFISGWTTPQVRLGAGNGTFALGGSFPVGTTPYGLVVFDFDGDLHEDFATANYGSNDISVRLGNGDGTFAAETRYPVGSQPTFLTLGDADSDGNEDLLIGYRLLDVVSLLPGNGDGTFNAEIQTPLVHVTGPIVVADYDDDGRPDLAVLSSVWDEVTILRGRGDGTFPAPNPARVQSAGPASSVASTFGDVNKDGLQDVVLLDDAGANSIAVLLADGTGAFVTSATDAAGTGPSDVTTADLDNDTNPDVIATNFDSNTVSIMLGNGDGTFAPVYSIPVPRDPVSIATGLFDADGNVDLALVTSPLGGDIVVLTGNGDGTFSLIAGGYSVGTNPVIVEDGDFDADGEIDLAVMNSGSGGVSILIGVGDGTFLSEVRYPLGVFSAESLVVADVDDDGHQDLVVHSFVLYGAGDGTFGAPVTLPVESVKSCALGDVNGDGRTDLVGGGSQVQLLPGEGGGSFGETTFFAGGGPSASMIIDDADGDGRNDLIQVAGGTVTTLLNVEPSPFNFLNDKITLRWPDVDGTLSYNVYRGLLSSLVDGDADGLPDTGYGDCQNALDPDTTDLLYVDASVPAPNSGYFYVIAVVDWAGERYLGTTSDGLPRVPALACP